MVPQDGGQDMPATRTVCGRVRRRSIISAGTAGCLGRLSRGEKERFGGWVTIRSWLGRSEGTLGWVGGHRVGLGRGKGLKWKRVWIRGD